MSRFTPYALIPKSATSNSAEVWVGCRSKPSKKLRLKLGSRTIALQASNWRELHKAGDDKKLFHQTVTLTGLAARARLRVDLVNGTERVATATVTTLPAALPGPDAPFTVLLGSCFCNRNDAGSRVDRAYRALRRTRPDIKILCGDQVYLDAPAGHFAIPVVGHHGARELRKRFLLNYWTTWTGGTAGESYKRGLRRILQEGANYFSPDDHEYWNDYPHWAAFVAQSISPQGRQSWAVAADDCYRAFQSPDLFESFDVHPLSFAFLNVRSRRKAFDGRSPTRFTPASEMQACKQWIANLRGVGVLTLGQPVFAEAGGVLDRKIQNYDQFKELLGALSTAKKPIILLSGDVHFRRVARARKGGRDLLEVISSPMTLVHSISKGKPKYDDVKTDTNWKVTADASVRGIEDAFLMLRFAKVARGNIRMDVHEVLVDEPSPLGRPSASIDIRVDRQGLQFTRRLAGRSLAATMTQNRRPR